MKRISAAVIAAAAAVALAQPVAAVAATPGAWTAPSCARVTGDGGVTFTTDDGATLAPTSGTLRPVSYTHGLAALDTPNTLLATRNNELQRSTDAGCTWTRIATLDSSRARLTAAPGGRAYAWEVNDRYLARVDGTTVTPLTSPTGTIVGLGTDRNRPGHVRVAAGDGQLYDSTDGGATWKALGTRAVPEGGSLYTVAFDPANIDHAVAGAMTAGGAVTTDGGRTWKAATGLTGAGGTANLFDAAVSPADPSVVYGLGIDLVEAAPSSGAEGRHLYRSADGGRTFKKVVDDSAETKLTNSTHLAPSPVDANVLYFEYGTYFQGYGTDLFRLNAATGKITKTHNAYDGISAFAFNPARPKVIYLGVEVVKVD
ncbi:dispase autolysis-inducing protein [Streptomyces sp. NPDC049577]|uniref:WD40/YVTN/BNR-like repeat-containing protein n=1 Tax=Streptomyces sp. NPDC049577 TaxID=3155153 RepID=UPI00342A2343